MYEIKKSFTNPAVYLSMPTINKIESLHDKIKEIGMKDTVISIRLC